ncbi:MAG TPA: GAF domain-containing sensor histidine kinase [Candidatus Dormibacteraeota bacterium]|nr:GAF domain-containing sensor histidine kinase [Candidatus Dormibacteraeota bacterium]
MPRSDASFGLSLTSQGRSLLAGRPLRRLLHTSLRTIGHVAGTRMASLHVLRDSNLVHVVSIGLSPDYVRALARIPIGVGCCGVAVAEARPVVIESIPCSRIMSAFQCLCEKHGLRSVWCLPLLASDNRVLGGLAIYYDRAHRPSLHVAREVEVYAEAIAASLEFSLDSDRSVTKAPSLAEGTRRVAAGFLDVQEAERRRIAEELHDELIQEMVGIQLMLECASSGEDDTMSRSAATSLGRLVAHLRELIFELHPLILDLEGLPNTISALLARLQTQTGIDVDFRCQLTGRLPSPTERLAYRVVREGIQNVKKHAAANRISVELTCRGDWLELVLSDDGVGFDPDLSLGLDCFGLTSMRHQVASLGGALETFSTPGRGTTLRARIPTLLATDGRSNGGFERSC